MSDFIQKLFTSYKERTDGDTRIGELYRIWYDSINNVFRIQLDDTPGGTIIGGGNGGGSDYTLPTASTTVKGGVKIDGTTITINNQVISGFSGSYTDLTNKPTIPDAYTLPTATDSILGGVKIGANISINAGVISVAAPFSGSYNDLTNKPTIPAAQVNSDWSASSGVAQILNKPTLFSGSYTDLTNKPTIYTSAYIGTTSLDFARESASQTLTGVSIDGSVVWTNPSPAPGTPWRTTINAASGKANIVLYSGLPGLGSSVSWSLDETKITFPDATTQSTAAVAQIQSDWTQSNNTSLDYIKNKPTIPDITDIEDALAATGEPMGHKDRSQSVISFDDASRTFSISPVSGSFEIWTKGVKRTITDTRTVTIPDTTGLYYIYFDTLGVLRYKTTFYDWPNDCMTAYVYWNELTNDAPFVADERHGITLDWQTHEYLHRTRGAAIANGFGATNYIVGADGSSDTHMQLDIASGTFFDEDLQVDIVNTNTPVANTWDQDLAGPAKIPMFYINSGGGWVIDEPTNFPIKQGTLPKYNLYSDGVWTTPDIDNNKFGVTFIIATNNINYPVIGIIGQAQRANIGDAEATEFSDLNLAGFPVVEMRPLYKLVYECKNSYTNSVNARLMSVWDQRNFSSIGSAIATYTDHGALGGLGDDDHPQYLLRTEAPTTVTVNGTSISLGSSGTVTADANTLTGTELKSTVVTSSLTSVGTLTSLTSSGAVSITNNTNSSSITTGALKVAGGVGIGGKLYVGDTVSAGAIDATNITASGTLKANNGILGTTQTTAYVFNDTATTVNIGGSASTISLGYSGTLTIGNSTVVGTQTTINLWNTTSTTVNFAGAATTLNLGASTGTTTVNNNLSMASGKTIGTTGSITSNNVTAFIAGDNAISGVALQIPSEGALRNLTNGLTNMYFDVSIGGSTQGQFQFRSSSSYNNVLTMSTTGVTFNTGATFTSRTPSLARTAFNSAIDTEITVDEMRFRISNQGGIFPQVIGNTSSRNLAWTGIGAISGSAVTQLGSVGTIVASNAWTTLYNGHGMDSAGDTVTVTLQDKAAGRIYRVTFMRSDNGSTTGYNIIAERLL